MQTIKLFVDHVSRYSIYSRPELVDKISEIVKVSSLDELFRLLNITYIAPYNLEDIEKYADKVDYITSQVVLEHVPPPILEELFRKSKE